MLDALKKFLMDSLVLGKLTDDYVLIAKYDIDGWASPGKNVVNIIRTWDHYSKTHVD